MKVLIDISEEMFKATQTYYSDNTTRLSIKSCIEKIANGTPISDNATNGDMIKAIFPNAKTWEITVVNITYVCVAFEGMLEIKKFTLDWWNAPYAEKRGSEE